MSHRPASGPSNRLAGTRSPYLLQHAHNPVDWYPWGQEAFEAAKERDQPIFLSIGYATCHWCHVMARESFEDPEIARLMNLLFVNVKVDREERPDVDHLYMTVLVAQSGRGGWPLSAWLTPQLAPYFAGTYFPPLRSRGMPAFPDVLRQMAQVYRERRDEALRQGQMVLDWARGAMAGPGPAPLDASALDLAYREYVEAFDARWGGFGGAPKFPRPAALSLLLRHHQRTGDARALEMVATTLDGMVAGGMYDQLAGGFCRYSTDARWLVPHFEKMLYDNAQLARSYLDGWLVTGRLRYREIAREVLDYLCGRMSSPQGGFHSGEDADSEGEEGKFAVWDEADLTAALGDPERVRLATAAYSIVPEGNFEHTGRCVLSRPREPAALARELGLAEPELRERLAAVRRDLLAARAQRVAPELDDKVLVAWSGLAIGAFAQAFQVLGHPADLERARRAAQFIAQEMSTPDGGLLRSWRGSPAPIPAMLDDYAAYVDGLIELYQADFDPTHLDRAAALTERVLSRFGGAPDGLLYQTEAQGELPVRTAETQDGATPAGTSIMAHNLWRLALLLDRPDWDERAESLLRAQGQLLARAPQAVAYLAGVLADWLAPPAAAAIVGPPGDPGTAALIGAVRQRFHPSLVLAWCAPEAQTRPAVLAGKLAVDGRPTAYLCRRGTCEAPCTDPVSWATALDALLRPPSR